MGQDAPAVVVIGGPNGAGKTTISRQTVSDVLGMAEFVNADAIAAGLSGFEPERAAMQAGRIMLARLGELAEQRASFAFETTLASRTFAPWLAGLVASGYELHVVLVWLRSPELAVQRVRRRVSRGGHFVPSQVVRRRYRRGIANFVNLYVPLATQWRVYDNSGDEPIHVAYRVKSGPPVVLRPRTWRRIEEVAREQANQNDR
jgi:predicted ABC-type ATPase